MKKVFLPLVLILFLSSSLVLAFFTFKKNTELRSSASEPNTYTLFSWKNISIPKDSSLKIKINHKDFPKGSEFKPGQKFQFWLLGNGQSNRKASFFGFSGAQGLWDWQHSSLTSPSYKQQINRAEFIEQHFAMLKLFGVKWVRMDFLVDSVIRVKSFDNWPNDISWNFSIYDKIFEVARKNDIQILANVWGTPSGASSYQGSSWWGKVTHPPIDLYSNFCQGADNESRCSDPRSMGSIIYNLALKKLVARYKPNGTFKPKSSYGISHWEIWNEPDIGFWCDPNNPKGGCRSIATYQTYVHLLRGAYKAVKTTDPKAKVVFGGIAQPEKRITYPVNSDQKITRLEAYFRVFNDNFKRESVCNYFDILSFHSYKDFHWRVNALSISNQAKNTLVNQCGYKPIWLTETGAATKWVRQEKRGNQPGADKLAGELWQGEYLNQYYQKLWQQRDQVGLDKVFWWSSRAYFFDKKNFPHASSFNWGSQGPWEYYSAVMEHNFEPRPALVKYGFLTKSVASVKNGNPDSSHFKKNYQVNLNRDHQLSFNIPASDLSKHSKYYLFWIADGKLSTAPPIEITFTNQHQAPITKPRFKPGILPAIRRRRIN